MNTSDLREYAKSQPKQVHPTDAIVELPSKDAQKQAKVVSLLGKNPESLVPIMAKPASKKSLFRKIFGGKESKTHESKPIILEFTKVSEGKESNTHESKPIILEFTKVSESIPQDKKKQAN